MGFRFTFEIQGEAQVLRFFTRLADEVKDWTPVWEQIRDDFKEIETKQFDSEGDYGSGGWQMLNPIYAAQKERAYPGRGIMVRTGLLRESLIGANPYFIYRPEPLQVTLGTQVGYAQYHQRGNPPRLVKRPLIELTDADKKRWSNLMQVYLIRLVNRL